MILCSGSHKAAIKVSAGVTFLPDVFIGKELISMLIQIIGSMVAVCLRAPSSYWLFVGSHPQILEGIHNSLPCGFLHM